MSEGARNFLVGLASIIALLGLSAMLMSFGELESLIHPRYQLLINTNNASGIRPGSSIEYNGVPVGVVDSTRAQPDPTYPVQIVCQIDSTVRLPADTQPVVSIPLVGGGATLQLQSQPEQGKSSPGFLPDDGSATITGTMRGGMFAQITEQLEQRMRPLMDSLERFNRLSDTYIALGQNLNNLLEPQTKQDLDGGAPPNLRTAVISLNEALNQAREGLTLASKFLGDEQMQADAKYAVQQARKLIDQATTAVDNYTQLAQSLQSDANDMTKRILPVMDTLGATLEDVRRLSKMASEGQGTVGQLINDADLYNSLNDAAIRLDRTLVQLQLLIQKMRAEGVGVKLF